MTARRKTNRVKLANDTTRKSAREAGESKRVKPVRSGFVGISPLVGAVRVALIGLLLTVAVVPGFAFFRGSAVFIVPLIVGAVLGFVAQSQFEALVGSTVFGAAVAMLSSSWLMVRGVEKALNDSMKDQTAAAAHYSAVISGVLINQVWGPLVQASDTTGFGALGLAVIVAAFCAAAASLFVMLRNANAFERLAPGLREKYSLGTGVQLAGKLLMIAVLAVLFFSANSAAKSFDERIGGYLPKGGYATDYMIYVRTVQDVARGNNYYIALKQAANDDARADRPDHYNLPRASWVRMPVLPWFLAHVGGKNLGIDVMLALLLATIGVGFVGWAFEKQLFTGAGTIVALLVVPYFGMVGTWEPSFLPDYWGGILAMLAFGLLLNRLTYPAVVVTLLAGLMREHMWLWVTGVGVGLTWLALVKKRWVPAAVTAGGFALVVAAYLWHWNLVNTTYRAILTSSETGGSLLGVAAAWTGLHSALARVSSVMDFAFMPYTLYRFNSAWFLVPAFAFLVWRVVRALIARRVAVGEAAALVFLLMEVSAILAQSYSSQYWAVMFMPIVLAATAGFVCELIKASSGIETA